MQVHDIIICWTVAHQNLEWQSLENYTQILCAVNLAPGNVKLVPENGKSCYTHHYKILMHIYEVTLGITQIILGVDDLLARSA